MAPILGKQEGLELTTFSPLPQVPSGHFVNESFKAASSAAWLLASFKSVDDEKKTPERVVVQTAIYHSSPKRLRSRRRAISNFSGVS